MTASPLILAAIIAILTLYVRASTFTFPNDGASLQKPFVVNEAGEKRKVIGNPKRWRRYNAVNQHFDSKPSDYNNEKADSRNTTRFVAECSMPTDLGLFRTRSYVYKSEYSEVQLEPVVMIYGNINDIGEDGILMRIHDQCLTSEVFGSLRCDCKDQLRKSMELIVEKGKGIIIYLQQEGRGIGISNKIAAYSVQDTVGLDTVEANTFLGFKDEQREYNCLPFILSDLGLTDAKIKLITNNPFKIEQLRTMGIHIDQRVPIQIPANPYNARYLRSKKEKMNHILNEEPSNIKNEAHKGSNQNKASNQSDKYALGKQTVLDAIAAIRDGKLVVVVDDADRENEGDLICAAATATTEQIGFMVRYTSGVLCVSLREDRLKELDLPPMYISNEDPKQTAYTVSVDYKYHTTTGISAADRALTFNKLVDPSAQRNDFQRPGHVFPLKYKEGGVLVRAGHTEASLDLTRLAGLERVGGVLAEIVHDDGSMMRLPDLIKFAERHNLVLTSVHDIKVYLQEINSAK